ncbi:hypothetical protein RSOL_387490 [Rhizoctonia solani AG-3 Rhs1AP]|uniref:MYND finger protein n=1 Tax=Rhizoctonia solani AG-3 Rhs1AP TaxID=1086054 RepID=X8JE53_9AGAM|nr:hypothetical protein RSOL_387490 [Rhizoctonia solani AG-3 Rhs1AP]
MTDTIPDEYWGFPITHYPLMYTNHAISTRLEAAYTGSRHLYHQIAAPVAINDISKLADPTLGPAAYNELISSVTLKKLKEILELTYYPSNYGKFASPELVAGCITLMSSLKPLPLAYEYGYLCLRVMVIALNACLLKYGSYLDVVIQHMKAVSSKEYLSTFWEGSARLISREFIDGDSGTPLYGVLTSSPRSLWTTPLMDQWDLHTLLYLLHDDKKNLFIALQQADSLGLSGVMFVLRGYVESKRVGMEEHDYKHSFYGPYSRVLYRYRLVVPNFGLEPGVMKYLCNKPPVMCCLEEEETIDVGDSRNLMQAYTLYLESNPSERCAATVFLFQLVAPLMVPGCEDLIPGVLGATLPVFWNSLSTYSPSIVIESLATFLTMFSNIVEPFRLKGVEQPWVIQLEDQIIINDTVELMLRVTLLSDSSRKHRGKADESKLIDTIVERLTHLMLSAPRQHLIDRCEKLGSFYDWSNYRQIFRPGSPGNPVPDGCQYIMLNYVFKGIFGQQWEAKLASLRIVTGHCYNPRCPAPVDAQFVCPTTGAVYCSSKCLALSWTYAAVPPSVK